MKFKSFDGVFETDRREQDGVWVEWPVVPGARFLLTIPVELESRTEVLARQYRLQHGSGPDQEMPEDAAEQCARKALFGTAIAGWEGVAWEGEKRPYNLENFLHLINRSRNFRNWLANTMFNSETYAAKEEEELTKKSKAASDGSSRSGDPSSPPPDEPSLPS